MRSNYSLNSVQAVNLVWHIIENMPNISDTFTESYQNAISAQVAIIGIREVKDNDFLNENIVKTLNGSLKKLNKEYRTSLKKASWEIIDNNISLLNGMRVSFDIISTVLAALVYSDAVSDIEFNAFLKDNDFGF